MKNGYELSRAFFDFAFEKTECKAQHIALYMWIIELNNRLKWKEEFGLPTTDAMEHTGISNRTTYMNTLRNLEQWNFIKVVQYSKNRYTSTVISVVDQHSGKDKDKVNIPAQIRAANGAATGTATGAATVRIDKQVNNEIIKQINVEEVIAFFTEKGYTEATAQKFFDYYESSNWIDGKGKPVLNWKQKAIQVWFKEEHKIPKVVFDFGPLNHRIEDDDYVKCKLEELRSEKERKAAAAG